MFSIKTYYTRNNNEYINLSTVSVYKVKTKNKCFFKHKNRIKQLKRHLKNSIISINKIYYFLRMKKKRKISE